MSSLLESLQMCMWFDVNIISRRNLLSAVLSSLLVRIFSLNIVEGDSSTFFVFVFLVLRCLVGSDWHRCDS